MNELTRNTPQTLAWEPLDSLHSIACPRAAVTSKLQILPDKYVENFQNHPNACCKEATNLDVEAWYSCDAEKAKGIPDIYKFYCNTCDACHVRFCIGGNHPTDPTKLDVRPFWEVR